jgi:catechol 2,3-dioxygenase
VAAPKGQAYEHAEIRVEDLGRAAAFYKDVIGLVELAREDGVVYLGCGFDENYDLAIREGGTGVAHFALRVEDEEALERYARRLEGSGVGVQRRDGTEPGQERGIRFTLPGGTEMELVLVADNRYVETFRPAHRSSGIQPLDADHINLTSTDVKGLSQWLRDLLDVKLSDVIELDNEAWAAAWLRMSWAHHDIGVQRPSSAAESLHHVAWTFASLEHMKMAVDAVVASGIRLELGISRHPVGSNLYGYFWEPGGNRFEFTCEMAILDPRTPARFWKGFEDTLDAWAHPIVPDTFWRGS